MPNTKFKALVLILSRMGSVGVSACVYVPACMYVCTFEIFGNRKTKLGGVRQESVTQPWAGRTVRHLYLSTGLRASSFSYLF